MICVLNIWAKHLADSVSASEEQLPFIGEFSLCSMVVFGPWAGSRSGWRSISHVSVLVSLERNRGTWSKEETRKLIKAVEESILRKLSPEELREVDSELQEHPERRLSIVRKKLYKGIPWVEVEARVQTRNWMQCKSKW